MEDDATARLLQPHVLAALMGSAAPPLIIDVSGADAYVRAHVPGAVHLDYRAVLLGTLPAPGLPAAAAQLQQVWTAIGVNRGQRVVAYDDQGSSRASRLLWTLEFAGHRDSALLDGGLAAWAHAGLALEQTPNQPTPGDFVAMPDESVLADKGYVLNALGDPRYVILDARSDAEYHGRKSPSARHGHIPGARHFDWLSAIDSAQQFRMKPAAELMARLTELGITPDKEIIVYCQTHHRSAHSFMMLRHLGYPRVRGYAGSWAEWGNDPALPIE